MIIFKLASTAAFPGPRADKKQPARLQELQLTTVVRLAVYRPSNKGLVYT